MSEPIRTDHAIQAIRDELKRLRDIEQEYNATLSILKVRYGSTVDIAGYALRSQVLRVIGYVENGEYEK